LGVPRPPAGQRLGLVAAGEEGELPRILGTDLREPHRRDAERLLPFDLAELALAALADPEQRLLEARRRDLGHDAGGTLGAEHALVHRMVAVALDVADAPVLQVHFDAAAAGAHVAGGGLHRVARRRRGVDGRLARDRLRCPVQFSDDAAGGHAAWFFCFFRPAI